MENIDLQMIAIWSVAASSLAIQIYLFVTWPRQSESTATTPSLNGAGLGNRLLDSTEPRTGNWEPPSESSLDGILSETFSSGARENGRRRRRRVRAPATMQERVIRAGIYRRSGMRLFQITRVVLTLAAVFSGFLVVPVTSLPAVFVFYIGAFAGLAAYLAPSFWLDRRLRVRQTKMRRALPDALDLITVCLQGGLSLPASLSRVARELGPAHPMLATELSIVEREIQMGRSTGSAMLQFAHRFDLEELRSLSSVVGQTEKYGGTIAGALKTYSESLRIRRRQHAEEMAQKAAVKLLFPTLFCIFPGIFVVILGPTAVRMYQVMSGITWGGG